MSKPIKIRLEWMSAPEITGTGNDLALKLEGHRINKAGNFEQYEIEAPMGRHCIQSLARQIATMHARDRQRLERELRRIELEQQAITQPEVQESRNGR